MDLEDSPPHSAQQQEPPKKKLSKIMALPLPKMDSEHNGAKPLRPCAKPIVIDKVQVGFVKLFRFKILLLKTTNSHVII